MKTVLLGISVLAAGILVLAAAVVASNRALHDNVAAAAPAMEHGTATMSTGTVTKGGMESFAGVTAADATERATSAVTTC